MATRRATCSPSSSLNFSSCPVKVARALYVEEIFDRKDLNEVVQESTVKKKKEKLIKFVKERLPDRDKHPKEFNKILCTFGTVLIRLNEVKRGKNLIASCCQVDCIPSVFLDHHCELMKYACCCFQKIDKQSIIAATQSCPGMDHLQKEVEAADSSVDAVNIVCNYTSLMNPTYLEKLSQHFKLHDHDVLSEYSCNMRAFFDSTVQEVVGLPLMPNFHQELLINDTVHLKLDWDSAVKTCRDVKVLLNKAFSDWCCHVMPHRLTNCPFVEVKCYAPYHLHGVLCRLARDNKETLVSMDTISVSIGGRMLWNRDKKLEMQCTSLKEENRALGTKVQVLKFNVKELEDENISLKTTKGRPLSKEEEKISNNMKVELDMVNRKYKDVCETNKALIYENQRLRRKDRARESVAEESESEEQDPKQESSRFTKFKTRWFPWWSKTPAMHNPSEDLRTDPGSVAVYRPTEELRTDLGSAAVHRPTEDISMNMPVTQNETLESVGNDDKMTALVGVKENPAHVVHQHTSSIFASAQSDQNPHHDQY